MRNNPDVNFYQYWAIEEAPIKNLVCPKSENNTESKWFVSKKLFV